MGHQGYTGIFEDEVVIRDPRGYTGIFGDESVESAPFPLF